MLTSALNGAVKTAAVTLARGGSVTSERSSSLTCHDPCRAAAGNNTRVGNGEEAAGERVRGGAGRCCRRPTGPAGTDQGQVQHVGGAALVDLLATRGGLVEPVEGGGQELAAARVAAVSARGGGGVDGNLGPGGVEHQLDALRGARRGGGVGTTLWRWDWGGPPAAPRTAAAAAHPGFRHDAFQLRCPIVAVPVALYLGEDSGGQRKEKEGEDEAPHRGLTNGKEPPQGERASAKG